MEYGVIYLLRNTVNGKCYIGQTIDLNRRIREHKVGNEQAVEVAIDKYGWDNFVVEILESNVPRKKLDEKEVKYIERYNTYKGRGYNCTEGGGSYEETDEMKKKVSKSMSGENHPFYGKHHTKETKEKISRAKSGKNNPMYGKTGEDNPNAKITEDKAKKIKDEYEKNKDIYQHELADKYDLSQATIGKIINGKHWATKNIE